MSGTNNFFLIKLHYPIVSIEGGTRIEKDCSPQRIFSCGLVDVGGDCKGRFFAKNKISYYLGTHVLSCFYFIESGVFWGVVDNKDGMGFFCKGRKGLFGFFFCWFKGGIKRRFGPPKPYKTHASNDFVFAVEVGPIIIKHVKDPVGVVVSWNAENGPVEGKEFLEDKVCNIKLGKLWGGLKQVGGVPGGNHNVWGFSAGPFKDLLKGLKISVDVGDNKNFHSFYFVGGYKSARLGGTKYNTVIYVDQ